MGSTAVCDPELMKKKCVPCEGGAEPLNADELKELMGRVEGWELVDNKSIKKKFMHKDFVKAIKFVNKVADVSEAEGHHPDIYIFYNKVKIELSTHAIGGLSENDFILATKIDSGFE